LVINYGREIEDELMKIEQVVNLESGLAARYPGRWLAIKLLEGDERLRAELQQSEASRVLVQADKSIEHLTEVLGEKVGTIIADRRYGFINDLVKKAVARRQTLEERLTLSDNIDRVVTNKYLGLPIFLLVMWGIFHNLPLSWVTP